MIVYKVVDKTDNPEYFTSSMHWSGMLTYILGKQTTPTIGALFGFEHFEQALRMVRSLPNKAWIMTGETTEFWDAPDMIRPSILLFQNEGYKWQVMDRYWNKKDHADEITVGRLDIGTICFPSFTPTELWERKAWGEPWQLVSSIK